MPVFTYSGYNDKGKSTKGLREAETARALRASLKREGILATAIEESRSKKRVAKGVGGAGAARPAFLLNFRTERVSAQDLAVMTRQLATLNRAGIPLVESLTALVEQVESEKLKTVLSEVKQRVNEGAALADALGDYPKIFSPLFVNMIRAGESSGALEVVLERLAELTESQSKLKRKVISTMFYPMMMLAMSLLVVGVLFVFVIPKIKTLFEAQKATLPLPTEILIGMSSVAQSYWWLFLLMIAVTVWGLRRWVKTPRGRDKWHKMQLKLPIFGKLIRILAIARFARTMATLLASGVPLLNALNIVKAIVENKVLVDALETARDAIREGESIAAPLKRSGQFPPIVTHMIAVGERSGQLEQMLGNVADSYDSQVESQLTIITSLMEPIMIVALGGIVAFIVFSIMLPMLEISSFAG